MKILVISHSAVIERYQQKFEFLANKLGHQVCLIIPKTWVEGGQQLVHGSSRRAGNLTVQTLTCLLRPRLRRHFYLGLSAVAKKFQPDLIYAEEEPQAKVTSQALKLARQLRAKFVFFTWENIPQAYSGRKKQIEAAVYQQSAGAIAGNQAGREILQKNGYRHPVEVIPQYGVDPNFFRQLDAAKLRQTLKLGDQFIAGYVGRLLPEKNIGSLLEAMAPLPKNVILLAIGNGPARAALARQSQELGLAARVKFIPAVKYEEMPEYFNIFDVLVLPSVATPKWKEQFGRVLIEAMACGVPVVGSRSGEIPNVIGNAGLIFPEGDTKKLAEQLKRLYTDWDLAKQLARNGLSRVQDLFTNERLAERLDSFFRTIRNSQCDR